MRQLRVLGAISLLCLLLSGCAVYADGYGGRNHPDAYDSSVPDGHLPAGECRVWYPDRPAGQQPPPGDCHELRHRVPSGAQLIRG